MDRRRLLLGGILAAGLVALLSSAACWRRQTDDVHPRSDRAAAVPAVMPAGSPVVSSPPGEHPPATAAGPATAALEAKPVEAITADLPGTGRTVIAADGLSGSAPAPTVGKPVAAIDVTWALRRDPAQPGAWTVAVTLTPKSGGQRLIATFTARVGAEVRSGASAIIAEPRTGHAYSVETVVAAQGPADLVLGLSLQGTDVRGRTITIPLPAAGGAAGDTRDPQPRSAAPSAPAAAQPTADVPPSGVIRGDGVILQPSR